MSLAIGFERTVVPVPPCVPAGLGWSSLDADVARTGEVVLVTRHVEGLSIHFPDRAITQRVPHGLRYPQVRWIGASAVLLFDAHANGTQPNAWVVDDDGMTRARFPIGDSIADVLVSRTHIVVTYSDEGVFGHDPLSKNGLATFTLGGKFLWGWNSTPLVDRAMIDDCYAACLGDDDATLGALLYTSYDGAPYAFATMDIAHGAVTLHAVPERLYRTGAVSSAQDGLWIFAVRTDDEEHVVAWRPGDGGYAVAPSPIRLTRGIGNSRFLSITDGSVETVTVTLRPRA